MSQVETANGDLELDQLKHTTGYLELSDSSVQIWRAIGNWCRLINLKSLDVSRIELALLTNGSVAKDSAISKLTSLVTRDVGGALEELGKVAASSQNKRTEKDRIEFSKFGAANQLALISAIRIVPNLPNLKGLSSEIEGVLYYACEPGSLGDFRAELEGWWFNRISAELSAGTSALVRLTELEGHVSYLREKYKRTSLHVDIEEPTEHPDNLAEYVFVKQVMVLEVGDLRIRNAQRDFLRASAQRSKWLREALVDPAELASYDGILEDTWSTQYAIAQDELPAGACDDEKRKAGRGLLGWAETRTVPLRGASAQFLTSGSYHALSDQCRLGWHPEFKKLFGGGE